MRPKRCTSSYNVVLIIVFLDMKHAVCSVVTQPDFNESIRKYSVKENDTTSNDVTTLLKQGKEQYGHFVPIPNPATFKQEVPDSDLSSTSYSRGLLHHSEYGLHDYEDPHHGYAYDYNGHDANGLGHHGFEHHSPVHFPGHHDHHGSHHVDYHGSHHGDYHGSHHGDYHGDHHHVGHHHKHYDHGLAAKALLWPIAGIALLGAAAAFVSNPVLLQLGAVSGRRKRRDTEEVTGPGDIDVKKWSLKQDITKDSETNRNKDIRRLPLNDFPNVNGVAKRINTKNIENVNPTVPTSKTVISIIPNRSKYSKSNEFVPIPLKMKPSKIL